MLKNMLSYFVSINVLKDGRLRHISAYVLQMFASLHRMEHHCAVHSGFNSQMVVGGKAVKTSEIQQIWLGMNIHWSQHSRGSMGSMGSMGAMSQCQISPHSVLGLPQWTTKGRGEPLAFLPTLEAPIEFSIWVCHWFVSVHLSIYIYPIYSYWYIDYIIHIILYYV